jgi:hypothetical protein
MCELICGVKGKGEGKGKGKAHPRAGHEITEDEKYSSTLSLTPMPDEVGGQRHTPAALPSGKTRYPLFRRLDGPQGRSGRVRKISLSHLDSIPGSSSQ